jgi:hypothetical protein
MREVTARMLETGYEAQHSVTLTSIPDGTVEDLALRHLFSGGEERSADEYRKMMKDKGIVIGPYVREIEDQPLHLGIALWRDQRFGMRRKVGDVSWGILGAGTVGARVIEQLSGPEIASRSGFSMVPDFVLRKAGVIVDGAPPRPMKHDEQLPDVDLLFVATPGIEGPESPAYQRIVSQLERRGLVVTAEKASLAEHFAELEELDKTTIGGFRTELENWVIVGGFQRVRENPLTSHFADHVGALAGASIGLGPQNQDGVYKFQGPGAGPKATANTMLDDAQVLIQAQRS